MKNIYILITLLLLSIIIVGCSDDTPEKSDNPDDEIEDKVEQADNVEEDDLDSSEETEQDEDEFEETNFDKETNLYTYTLFRSDEESLKMIDESLESTIEFTPYPHNEDNLEKTIMFLFEELKTTDLHNATASVPEDVNLIGVYTEDNIVTLDFDESVYEHIESGTSEYLFVDTLISTIINNIKDIDHLYLSVNGERIDVLNDLDVSDGFNA